MINCIYICDDGRGRTVKMYYLKFLMTYLSLSVAIVLRSGTTGFISRCEITHKRLKEKDWFCSFQDTQIPHRLGLNVNHSRFAIGRKGRALHEMECNVSFSAINVTGSHNNDTF